MANILAIETSTDACSIALLRDGKITARHEQAARQHNQRLFSMLAELLPSGDLREQNIDAIAYGCGPGSFTGLRIAASAVQGLSYANGIPAVAISTLAAMAQNALTLDFIDESATVLSTLDARINEIYAASYRFEDGRACLNSGPWVCAPEDLPLPECSGLHAVGNGCQFLSQFPTLIQNALLSNSAHIMPTARDILTLAQEKLSHGEVQRPAEVQPVYLREEISWKKIAQQGKQT